MKTLKKVVEIIGYACAFLILGALFCVLFYAAVVLKTPNPVFFMMYQ